MMDQLLERDATAPEIIAEMSSGGLDSTLDDTHHDSQMLTQDESQIEAQQMSQDEEEEDDEDDDDDHESESSRESHFEGANDENDDGIEVEGEEEEDEDEDDEDEGTLSYLFNPIHYTQHDELDLNRIEKTFNGTFKG